MNGPLGQENKVQGMTAQLMPSAAYVLVLVFAAKVKKVSHELEMSRVGKRVQERVKGKKSIDGEVGSNSESSGKWETTEGFVGKENASGHQRGAGGGQSPGKDVEEGLGQDGEGEQPARATEDRQGGCAGRWGALGGGGGGRRTETPLGPQQRLGGLHALRGLCSEVGSRQLRTWPQARAEEVWRRTPWGHQHLGDTDWWALGRTNPRAAAALRGRERGHEDAERDRGRCAQGPRGAGSAEGHWDARVYHHAGNEE